MKRFNPRFFLALALAYMLMLLLNFYAAWFVLPDLIFLTAATAFFSVPHHHGWLRSVLLFSMLMDTAAHVPLGFHALFYACGLLLLHLLKRFWLTVSSAGRVTLLLLACALSQMMRCLLLFLWTGITAPHGWFWMIPLQALFWPLYHQIVAVFLGQRDAN